MKTKRLSKFDIVYIVESLAFLVLCFFFVPKIDDVIFKYNEFFQFNDFKEFLHSVIYYGNGRFLGNGLGILFSKIPEIFYFVEFITVQLFCFAFEKLTEIKNAKLYSLTVFLLQPIFFVKQIESWLCGFINYFVPILLLVYILLIVKNDCRKEISKNKKIFHCILIILLGFSEQLFVQHNSVMNLIIAISILLYFIYKKKKLLEPVLLIVSNVVGCIVLFGYSYYIDFEKTWVYGANSSYGGLIFSMDSVTEMLKTLVSNIGVYIYIYLASIVIYTILLAVILHIDKTEHLIKLKKLNMILMLLYYPLAASVFALCLTKQLMIIKYAVIIAFGFVLNFIGLAYSFFKTVYFKMPKKLKIVLSIVLIYSFMSTVPFLVYSVTGAFRGIWFAYMLLSLFVLIVADFARNEYGFKFEKQLFIFSVCACVVTACYIPAYAVQKQIYNYKAENYSTEYYLPASDQVLVDQDLAWHFAEGNIDHEFIPYKEFKAMQK